MNTSEGFTKALADQADGWLLLFAVISAVVYAVLKVINFQTTTQKLNNAKLAFESVVKGLASSNESERVAAAVMIRRFFDPYSEFGLSLGGAMVHKVAMWLPSLTRRYKNAATPYQLEATNLIASVLKGEPIGAVQKTLADSLAYAPDLSHADLQSANLYGAYLGKKDDRNPIVAGADFYMANLTRASLKGIDATGAYFKKALMHETVLRGTRLLNANFEEADLLDAEVNETTQLEGANFKGAVNVPQEILKHLDRHGIYKSIAVENTDEAGSAKTTSQAGQSQIFISCPGEMSPAQEIVMERLVEKITSDRLTPTRLKPDQYQKSGQISAVKGKLLPCAGMICFAYRDLLVIDGVYRPKSKARRELKEQWLSSPWLHAEVAMAVMQGMPVLIVKENINEGLFDDLISETSIQVLYLDDFKIRDFKTGDPNSAYSEWLSKIKARAA